MNISVIILSGGRSVRMGQDKARLMLKKEDFLNTLAEEFSADPRERTAQTPGHTGAGERSSLQECMVITQVLISAAHEGDYADLGLPVLPDEHQGIGPIEGIRQGLRFAQEEYVFVCAVDMPFVKRQMAVHLTELISDKYDAYVYRADGRVFPTCAIYHRSLLPVIEDQIRNGRCCLRDFLDSVRTGYADIEESMFRKEVLMNINTPEQYRAAHHFCRMRENCGN